MPTSYTLKPWTCAWPPCTLDCSGTDAAGLFIFRSLLAACPRHAPLGSDDLIVAAIREDTEVDNAVVDAALTVAPAMNLNRVGRSITESGILTFDLPLSTGQKNTLRTALQTYPRLARVAIL